MLEAFHGTKILEPRGQNTTHKGGHPWSLSAISHAFYNRQYTCWVYSLALPQHFWDAQTVIVINMIAQPCCHTPCTLLTLSDINDIRQSLWTDLQTEGPLAHQHSTHCYNPNPHHSKKEAALEVEGVCIQTPLYHHRGPQQTSTVEGAVLWYWACLVLMMIST